MRDGYIELTSYRATLRLSLTLTATDQKNTHKLLF